MLHEENLSRGSSYGCAPQSRGVACWEIANAETCSWSKGVVPPQRQYSLTQDRASGAGNPDSSS